MKSGLVVFLCLAGLLLRGQDSLTSVPEDSGKLLLRKFLSPPGHEDEYIMELIDLAKKDNQEGHTLDRFYKIQVALILEQQLAKPSKAAFELNKYAGEIIRNFDLTYALEFYQKATVIADALPEIPDKDKFTVYTNRAGIHNLLHQENEALEWFRKAIVMASHDNLTSLASACNNLGTFYQDQQQPDSARYYFQKALTLLAQPEKNVNLISAIKDNIAQLDMAEHHYQEAYRTFLHNDSLYQTKQASSYKYLSNKLRLMESMLYLNMSGIADSIEILVPYIASHHSVLKSKDIIGFYRFAENYFYQKDDRSKELYFRDQFAAFTDSLEQTKADQLRTLTKSLLAVQEISFQNEMRTRTLETEKTKLHLLSARRLAFLILFSAAGLFFILVLYFQKRRQELHAQRQVAESALKYKEFERRLMEQELELKKKDLTNVVLHNTQVHDTHRKLIDRLSAIHGPEERMNQQIRALLHEIEAQNQIGDRALSLQQNIEAINAGFYEKLMQRYPNLTKAESELCGYIRINLSTKDISILKNIEAGSVKMSKNRLRKKLGIGPDDDLFEVVQNIG
jgi:hypothetical protein